MHEYVCGIVVHMVSPLVNQLNLFYQQALSVWVQSNGNEKLVNKPKIDFFVPHHRTSCFGHGIATKKQLEFFFSPKYFQLPKKENNEIHPYIYKQVERSILFCANNCKKMKKLDVNARNIRRISVRSAQNQHKFTQ